KNCQRTETGLTAMDDARVRAVKMLGKTFARGGFSNILLDKSLNESEMTEQEKAFCAALYYGVLERKITLDHIISQYSKTKVSKINPVVLNILRTGIYQLEFMDNVPDSAAVNESVKMTKKLGFARLSGFVNAVMRSFIRDDKKINYPKDKLSRLSVEYSVPQWFAQMICGSYSQSQIHSLLAGSVGQPPLTARINTLKGSREEILERMSGLDPQPAAVENCYRITGRNIKKDSAFKDGLFHVQDIGSQLCCMALSPEPEEIILDMCSAPGGKAFTMAQLAGDKAMIYAFDIYDHRVKLIRSGAERLGIRSVKPMKGDASVFNEKIPEADKVLCDVPCSGLGVIRRKPEIKYKQAEEFDGLPEIQYNILENAAKYLRAGGELVYSTCTINPAENSGVIDRFLSEHSNFEGISFLEHMGEPFGSYKATLFPENFGSDGFFISKIRRTE
ncbi:MAG: 16S rRNA (cytosine(967)-C(5))-methyltransferase RsmB, partial [Porcipelethomonas sp.]